MCPAVLDRDVLTFAITCFSKTLAECRYLRGVFGRLRIEEHNYCQRGLLRTCRERPCGRAAEQRDELATPDHVWMAPAWQEIIWRAAQRSLAVMCPACWCSPGGLLALMGSANRVLI